MYYELSEQLLGEQAERRLCWDFSSAFAFSTPRIFFILSKRFLTTSKVFLRDILV